MSTRFRFGLFLVALWAIGYGCTESDLGLNSGSDSKPSDCIPITGSDGDGDVDVDFQICEDFCNAAAKCQWGESLAQENSPGKFYEGQCMIKCSYYLTRGAFVVRRSTECKEYDDVADACWQEVDQEEFLDNIGGESVKSYLGCMAAGGAWKCNNMKYQMIIASEEECSGYATCIGALGTVQIPTPQWVDGQCRSASESNEAYYVDIVL